MCFIVTGQLWMFKRQLGQMKEDSDQSKVAAKLARDEFTASHRPWIAAEVDITNDLKWDANGLSFTVNVSLRNFGNAPARNVTSNHEVVAPVGTRIDAKAAQAALNDSLKIATEQAGVLGDVVFPSEREPKKLGLLVSIKRDQIKIYQTENSIGPRTSIPIVVVACIGYRSALTGDFHSTGVVFSVMRRGESAAVVPVEIDVDVTADHIGIVRNFCGSGIVT